MLREILITLSTSDAPDDEIRKVWSELSSKISWDRSHEFEMGWEEGNEWENDSL